MKTGISTSSLFLRRFTEDALAFLAENGVKTAEIFLASYCEYNAEFGKILKSRKGNIDVHSVHTLTTQFEPQLYSVNKRACDDSFKLLEMTMQAAREVGAKFYTFHGSALLKKTKPKIDFDKVGETTARINDVCGKYGVTLAYENVHWCYYSYPGFFSELKKRCPFLKGVLDIKQAAQSGFSCGDYIDDMKGDIVTVHLSDIDENGKLCLPFKGVFDFDGLFRRLRDVGFDGALLIEVYPENFREESELLECADRIGELAGRIFT